MQQHSHSEVARLMQQISDEHNAAYLALHGVAAVASHQAITARMENIGKCQEQLVALVGPQKAVELTIIALGSAEIGKPGSDEKQGAAYAPR
ncbi:MAG TPA: hypothetical protein VKR06_00935 [Ktedonosporobacter sp.]|nr:hypothetical protein [Ktedonosporobacter sp.]